MAVRDGEPSYGRILRGMLYMLDFTSSTFSARACVSERASTRGQARVAVQSDDSWLTVPFCRCLSLRVPRGPMADANTTRQLMKKHQRCWLRRFLSRFIYKLSSTSAKHRMRPKQTPSLPKLAPTL